MKRLTLVAAFLFAALGLTGNAHAETPTPTGAATSTPTDVPSATPTPPPTTTPTPTVAPPTTAPIAPTSTATPFRVAPLSPRTGSGMGPVDGTNYTARKIVVVLATALGLGVVVYSARRKF